MPLITMKGKISFLRVGDPAIVWGGADDSLRTEVVAKLDVAPDIAFGFDLEQGDPALPSRLGMLSVLRDAFVHKLDVGVAVEIPEGKRTGSCGGASSPDPRWCGRHVRVRTSMAASRTIRAAGSAQHVGIDLPAL